MWSKTLCISISGALPFSTQPPLVSLLSIYKSTLSVELSGGEEQCGGAHGDGHPGWEAAQNHTFQSLQCQDMAASERG